MYTFDLMILFDHSLVLVFNIFLINDTLLFSN